MPPPWPSQSTFLLSKASDVFCLRIGLGFVSYRCLGWETCLCLAGSRLCIMISLPGTWLKPPANQSASSWCNSVTADLRIHDKLLAGGWACKPYQNPRSCSTIGVIAWIRSGVSNASGSTQPERKICLLKTELATVRDEGRSRMPLTHTEVACRLASRVPFHRSFNLLTEA